MSSPPDTKCFRFTSAKRCMEPLILSQLLYCVKLLHPAHLTSEPNKNGGFWFRWFSFSIWCFFLGGFMLNFRGRLSAANICTHQLNSTCHSWSVVAWNRTPDTPDGKANGRWHHYSKVTHRNSTWPYNFNVTSRYWSPKHPFHLWNRQQIYFEHIGSKRRPRTLRLD